MHAMSLIYTANLIFIIVLNVLLFFSGICLNSLVIVSFWRSAQLRKKLCYFAIMLLSCCDLLVVLTNAQFMILIAECYGWRTSSTYIPNVGLQFLEVVSCIYGFFFKCSFGNEFWSIFGDILSNLSSNTRDEGETFNLVREAEVILLPSRGTNPFCS